MNSLSRTLARLDGNPVDRLPAHPLFMIYAADLLHVRYSEYVQDHRLLVKGQMALLDQFPIDVVSCCSDAWREAADCGAELVWEDHLPPHAARPLIRTPLEFARLQMPRPCAGGRMTDRLEAVRLFAAQVKGTVPILGWIEGPLAQAVNLCGLDAFLTATLETPAFAAELMDWTLELEARFALGQVEAGADLIGIGDAAASLVSPEYYAAEVAPREKRIIDTIHQAGARVRLHICGDVRGKFRAMADTGADLIDIDFPQTLAQVRAEVGPDVCLAGNVHPVEVLYRGTPDMVRRAFEGCRSEAGERYILAAGCEIPAGTPEPNLRALFDFALQSR